MGAVQKNQSTSLISDRIPDETMILTFRHLLEKHGLSEQIFDTMGLPRFRGHGTNLPISNWRLVG
jgi:hypothetical protein